jgi:hypothetical protein
MKAILAQRSSIETHDLNFFGDSSVVFHCHHFNLFLDQTIDDALGRKTGTAVRVSAAREASYQLLSSLVRRVSAESSVERLELAQSVFAAMGHGRLALNAPRGQGSARGDTLHYGHSWFEKYGQSVRRRHPADAFAAGFAAAATEVAYDLPRESVGATETRCVAMRDQACEFDFVPGAAAEPRPVVDLETTRALLGTVPAGCHESRISEIAGTLRAFLAGVSGDERGLVQAFGVFVTMHLAGYYNRVTYDTQARIMQLVPRSVHVFESLLRESGHVCVFNTFGGLLLSPEWEGAIGSLRADAEEIAMNCCAIARALGFGRWTLREFIPGERLVIDTPATYECPYYLTRHGRSERPSCFFLQGAALAIMQLASRVQWDSRPRLTQDFYNKLFRGGLPWRVEQGECVTRGDGFCRVVVSRK